MMAAVVEQVRQRLDGRSVGDPVPVVDDDADACAALVDLVDQRRKRVAPGVVAAFLECLPQIRGQRGPHAAHRLDQVRKEPHQVVVIVVDGQPCDCDALLDEDLAPLRGQRGLTEPRGPVDHEQPPTTTGAQSVDQASAPHQRAGGVGGRYLVNAPGGTAGPRHRRRLFLGEQQRRVVAKDRGLQLPQRRTRVDAELVGE